MRLAARVDDVPASGVAAEVLSLCRAVRDARNMLSLSDAQFQNLVGHVAAAEQSATSAPLKQDELLSHVRAMRYILVEVADGPIAAYMADAAAQIIGDGVGRLFS